MVKSWLVHDQTVHALASPKANELTIPEQTATGKGTSNPLMAGSLPKTTKPTRLPLSVIPYLPGSSKVAAVDELLVERNGLLRQLKDSLLSAKQRMEVKANRKRRDVEFNVEDMVLVKIQPYHEVVVNFPEELQDGQPVEQPLAICDGRNDTSADHDVDGQGVRRSKRDKVAPTWFQDFVMG
ncbi:hypothetical protein Tco_0545409 [Tanacetum coccineum]